MSGRRGRAGGRFALAAVCTLAAVAAIGAPPAAAQVSFEWEPLFAAPGATDVAGPRSDGRLVVAGTDEPLKLFAPGGALAPFATGPNGHLPHPASHEPYVAVSDGHKVKGAGCSFKPDQVFQIETGDEQSVFRISREGRARKLAELPSRHSAFLSAITFDGVGRFGGRLLVALRFGKEVGGRTVDIYGIDCRGETKKYVDDAPEIEGGMEVAPRSFEPYAGRLIAADETDGTVFAYKPNGSFRQIATVGAPVGYDVGIESIAFVPAGFGPGGAAYMADKLFEVEAPPPDDGAVMVASAEELAAAGVGPGDMIGVTEGGAETFEFACTPAGCTATQVGSGPDATHAEGHIAFGPAP